MKRTVTKQSLADWDNAEKDIEDDLFVYFEDTFGRWDWVEISDEARSVWNLMFHQDMERHSPMDCIFSAIAAQSKQGAFAAVAAALGVDAEELESAVSPWYESQNDPPPPCGIEGLEEKLAEAREWFDEINAQRKTPNQEKGG